MYVAWRPPSVSRDDLSRVSGRRCHAASSAVLQTLSTLQVTIRGTCRPLSTLLGDAFRLFTRSPDNWTGDVVSSLTLENLLIIGAASAVKINGQGLSLTGAMLRNIESDGILTQENTAGKPFYTSQVYFSNVTAGILTLPQ